MTAISKRLCRLEGRPGVAETETARGEREFAETLRRRIATGRACGPRGTYSRGSVWPNGGKCPVSRRLSPAMRRQVKPQPASYTILHSNLAEM